MSYPEPRYFGDQGEISAVYTPAARRPDLMTDSDGTIHYLATQASTDNEFGLYRVTMGPGPGGTSTHFHRTMSESFYVLSGALRLFDGKDWTDATAGDFLYVPPGGLHAFRNDSGEAVSFLMLFTPGAPREAYFEGLFDLADRGDRDREEFFVRHDSYFTDLRDGPYGGMTTRDTRSK